MRNSLYKLTAKQLNVRLKQDKILKEHDLFNRSKVN